MEPYHLYNTKVSRAVHQIKMQSYDGMDLAAVRSILKYFFNEVQEEVWDRGYDTGYDAAIEEGYGDGFFDGREEGYNQGYGEGKSAGFLNASRLLAEARLEGYQEGFKCGHTIGTVIENGPTT